MNLHQEHHFEKEICAHLAAHGWLHDPGDAALFDRASGLWPADLLAWLESSQPQALDALGKTHGAALAQVLAERIRKNLDQRGTLDVLRRGVEMLGLRAAKEQFANSPDLKEALMHAIMDALDAHQTMSTQALGSERVRDGLKDILLGPAQLYEALRSRGTMHQAHP
ncbi:MAG TPA: hypothetical protein VIP31_08495 [Acidovorax sp.]